MLLFLSLGAACSAVRYGWSVALIYPSHQSTDGFSPQVLTVEWFRLHIHTQPFLIVISFFLEISTAAKHSDLQEGAPPLVSINANIFLCHQT